MIDFKKNVSETKSKDLVIYAGITEIEKYEFFKEMIDMYVNRGVRYTMLLRLAHLTDSSNVVEYKILGDQWSLLLTEDDLQFDLTCQTMYDIMLLRLELITEEYNIDISQVIDIQIMLYYLGEDVTYESIKPSREEFCDKKDLSSLSSLLNSYNFSNLINNPNDTGSPLSVVYYKDRIIEVITLDGTKLNIPNLLKPYYSKFDTDTKFYEKKVKDTTYLFVVANNYNIRTIYIFSFTGLLVRKIVYTLFNEGECKYTRQTGNVTAYINEKGIYKTDINIRLPIVYPYKLKGKSMVQPTWKIGTLDLETYNDQDISKTYAIGFYTKNNMNTFYLDNNLDSDKLILGCLDKMLTNKYHNYTFYAHNFGRFDVYFIYHLLIANQSKYKTIPYFRDDKMLALKITSLKTDKTGKPYSIKIVDSCNFFPQSLAELSKSFDTDIKKGQFPYNFVSKNTLFYKGVKPDYWYYLNNDTKKNITYHNYSHIKLNDWDLKEETLSYLEGDLISLFDVMEKFMNRVFINYNIQVTDSLTISSLSMDIFLRKYHHNDIPLIKVNSMYNDIKKSYYGGVSEVYKPYGKNLYYYDVNSLYPYAALNYTPGNECVYTDNINLNIKDMDDIFGFYYCKIIASDNYIGLLPLRSDSGLTMPIGEYEGWYFSEELKFATENGYKVHVMKGYKFNKVSGVFNSYVNDLYRIKAETKDPVERQMVKSLLNNLLGRFGLDINKYVTRLVSESELKEIIQTRKVRGMKFINDKVLLSYEKSMNKDICVNHDIDFKSIISDNLKDNKILEEKYHDVSVVISSCVTAYARIYMSQIKLDILKRGGSIYYTDTDSIVTDKKLPDHLVGNNIGQFKLEHDIDEAYFISNKTYAMKTNNNGNKKTIIKSKGIFSGSLSYESIKDLYLGNTIKGDKYETNKSYSQGSAVLFVNKTVSLSPDSYTKRRKIYDKENNWIDTKPLRKTYHTINKKCWNKNYTYLIYLYIWCLPLFYLLISFIVYSMDFNLETEIITECITHNLDENITTSKPSKHSELFTKNLLNKVYTDSVSSKINYHCNLSEDSNLLNNNLNKPKVVQEVFNYHLNNVVKENDSLKEKLSIMEIELQKYRIHKLRNKLLYDSIIKEVDSYLKKD